MPEQFSANGSRDPFLSVEERRRMTEENRARAKRNAPQTFTEEMSGDHEARMERYRRSAMNYRAAAIGDETSVSGGAALNDEGYPRGPRGGFSYVAGANAFAPWHAAEQETDESEEAAAEEMHDDAIALPDSNGAGYENDVSHLPVSDVGRFVVVSARRFGDLLRSGLSKKPLAAIRVFFLAVAALALLGGTIYCKVQTNEIYTDIAAAQAKYDDLKATNVSLRSEIDGKTTVKNVEQYAEDVLGLKQLDDSQIKYIKIQTEDEVIIAEPELSFWDKIQEKFRDVWAWLRGV